ncbi:MAG: right-handed parallel beta-helix repeat-containing protein [bacterium]|jgi:hypothetical protein
MTDDVLNLFVSPLGNDRWFGTLVVPSADGSDGPLATLAGARDAIRRLKHRPGGLSQPVTVHVAAGVYELVETLRFTPEDCGTAECPIRFVAAAGAAPVISGGRRITGWRETQHNGLRCWVAELPDVVTGKWNFTRLYVNDTPRQRPRLPKTGFHRFTGLAGCEDSGFKWGHGPDRANFAPGEIRLWHNWQDAEIISYQLWFDTHHRIKAIDEATGTVHFLANSLGSLKDERGEFARYFVENVFEALDTPGEWYLDRVAGRLHYLPLAEESLATTTVYAPQLEEIVRIQGEANRRVMHLHFENLTFAHQHWELPSDCTGYIQAAFGVPGAIILEGAEACIFYGCTIAHVNGYGLEVLAGSTENVIAACVVHDTGAGGVKVGHEQYSPHEAAVGKPMTGEYPPIATTVVDCTIRDCGHIFPSAIGIWVGNSGWNRLIHNRIFNCDYTGISCGWIWGYAPSRTVCNRIEYNHIHHINHREILSDNGGIYTLGQQPGTVLRGNVIHDISCYGYGAWGIYPDEGSSEMRVEQNLVCGTKKAAYSTHYGRDNLVQNNIFANSREDHLGLGKHELHRSTVFRRNVVLTANGRIQTGGTWEPAHYTASDNLYWTLDGTPLTFHGQSLETLQKTGQNLGAVVADPLFLDGAGGDFSLRPDSPALQTGFRPFDWRSAGPRLSAEKPLSYEAYSRRFGLTTLDVPVVRTQIRLITPMADLQNGGLAEFSVTLTNVGRAATRGAVRLSGGPKGAAGSPSVRKITYALQPGEAITEHVTLKVRRDAQEFWLDSEPTGKDTVPARALVMGTRSWQVPLVDGVETPETIPAAVKRVTARRIAFGERTAAEVKLAASDAGLLFHARFHEPTLRPNPEQPWAGTGFELVVYQPIPADFPIDKPLPKMQVCLVPRAGGVGADGVRVDVVANKAVPAPEIRLCSQPVSGGCELAAIIPWALFGFEQRPTEFPFDLVTDVVDPVTGGIVQLTAGRSVWKGWRSLKEQLTINA